MIKILISLNEFVLYIDSLTTVEFCEKFGCSKPSFTGDVESSAEQFIMLDAIKYRLIKDYAKFLETPLTDSIFTGPTAIFTGFKKCEQNEAMINKIKCSFDDFGPSEYSVTLYKENVCFDTWYHLKKINDLVGRDLIINYKFS